MTNDARTRIAAALGRAVRDVRALSGGSVATVVRARLDDGRDVVAKLGTGDTKLDIEARMLTALRARSSLPVPDVLHAAPDLLVMTWIENDGGAVTPAVEADAARHLAALHDITNDTFGFPFDTLIGGLDQLNPATASWRDFFRDARLLHMAARAHGEGRIDGHLRARIERLSTRLDELIPDDRPPSLLHGDMWRGNVLVAGARVAGFVDPACYFGDAEIELAFATLFGTFGDSFFRSYAELRPFDAAGFFEARRDLYNLYPLLVHVRLFGGAYVAAVERTLARFGC